MNLEYLVLKWKAQIVGNKQSLYRALNILNIIDDAKTEELCKKNIMGYVRSIERYCDLNNIDLDRVLKLKKFGK